MLETIKTEIKNLPCISFQEYFQRYVFAVQDSNIDTEFQHLRRQNLTPKVLSSLLNEEQEKMQSHDIKL